MPFAARKELEEAFQNDSESDAEWGEEGLLNLNDAEGMSYATSARNALLISGR